MVVSLLFFSVTCDKCYKKRTEIDFIELDKNKIDFIPYTKNQQVRMISSKGNILTFAVKGLEYSTSENCDDDCCNFYSEQGYGVLLESSDKKYNLRASLSTHYNQFLDSVTTRFTLFANLISFSLDEYLNDECNFAPGCFDSIAFNGHTYYDVRRLGGSLPAGMDKSSLQPFWIYYNKNDGFIRFEISEEYKSPVEIYTLIP
jgi:hypothetical protein